MKRFLRNCAALVLALSITVTIGCGTVRTFYGDTGADGTSQLDPNSPAAAVVRVLNAVPGWGQLAAGIIALGGIPYAAYRNSKNQAAAAVAAHVAEDHSSDPAPVPLVTPAPCPTCGQTVSVSKS